MVEKGIVSKRNMIIMTVDYMTTSKMNINKIIIE
jgi:hypothetical protein